MGYFSVKDFERHQHYKDRNPPWIKLHNTLLGDYEFCKLPDASKMHLVAIWLLASRTKNRVPADAEWIAKQISATEKVDLDVLIEAGFIVLEQGCSETLAERKQSAMPETEREAETEVEKEKKDIGRAKRAPRNSGTKIPDGFPGEAEFAYPRSRGWSEAQIQEQAFEFREYWLSPDAAKGGRKKDWKLTWERWVRNTRPINGPKQSQSDKDNEAFREAARRIGANQ